MDLKINNSVAAGKKKKYRKVEKRGKYENKTRKKITGKNTEGKKNTIQAIYLQIRKRNQRGKKTRYKPKRSS